MKKLTRLLFCSLVLQTAYAQQWSMGFWSAWAPDPIADLDWGGLTHVMELGVEPQSDGSLKYSDPAFSANAKALIAAAHANNVKVLLNVWSAPGSNFNAAITGNLNVLADNLMNLVNTYGYDGLDLDWEAGLTTSSMATLVSTLRSRLGGKLLTADASVTDYAFWGSVQANLDRVNVMTYDLNGTWNGYSWFNSALYGPSDDSVWSIELATRRFLGAGIPAAKLNIGIPFYGYVSSSGGITGPRQPWGSSLPGLSQIAYHNIAQAYDITNPQWDGSAQVPYISLGIGWISFDNPQSVTAKVNYAKTSQLGGWIIWALDQDYFPSGNPKHPLLAAIKAAMGGAAQGSGSGVTPPPPPAAVDYYAGDMNWTSATNGWGTIQRNLSIQGNPLTLHGTSYARGLGVHANSTVSYNLGGSCSTFQAAVGVDAEVGANGSIYFQVIGDGVSLYRSSTLTGSSPSQSVKVSVAGHQSVSLVVTTSNGSIDYDHADWANARFTCAAPPPSAR